MGLKDKNHLAKAHGKKIGKASVSSCCIKFEALKDIDTDVLAAASEMGRKLSIKKIRLTRYALAVPATQAAPGLPR
jgi:hypothetical protein